MSYLGIEEWKQRATPPFPLFAPVQFFSLRFLNRRKRRMSKGRIGELFFDCTRALQKTRVKKVVAKRGAPPWSSLPSVKKSGDEAWLEK